MPTRAKSVQHARDTCDFWNLNYPVGTPVKYPRSRQPDAIHLTRSEAIVEKGVPCVAIGDRKGRVPLSSLVVLSDESTGAGKP